MRFIAWPSRVVVARWVREASDSLGGRGRGWHLHGRRRLRRGGGDAPRRQVADRSGRSHRGAPARVRQARDRAAGDGAARARHHDRDQRHPRAQGCRRVGRHHARIRRHPGDRAHQPDGALRHPGAQARLPRAAPARPGSGRADGLRRVRAAPARRGGGRRGGRADGGGHERRCPRRRRHLLPAQLREPRPRGDGRAPRPGAVARLVRVHVARGPPRVEGVRALQHGGAQRLRGAAGRPLPDDAPATPAPSSSRPRAAASRPRTWPRASPCTPCSPGPREEWRRRSTWGASRGART
jgi:hypothetical protein